MTLLEQLQQLAPLAAAATEVAGFPGYSITREGIVLSTDSNWRGYGSRQLAQRPNKHGYASVRLGINGKRCHKTVHSLVAAAFLGPKPTPKHEIRHLNGNKLDARSANLAWGTAAENAADRERHGNTARGEANGFAKLSKQDVEAIRAATDSLRTVAKRFNVHNSTISRIKNNTAWASVS